MKIGLFTDSLAELEFEAALDWIAPQGIEAVEIGTGNFSPAPHCDLARLVGDEEARRRFMGAIGERGLTLSALNCSGNPLDPNDGRRVRAQEVLNHTLQAASLLGIDTVVAMSGCPGDLGGGNYPNWVTCTWQQEYVELVDRQWEEVIEPYWQEVGGRARDLGVRIAIEMHPGQAVYNTRSLQRLRETGGADVIRPKVLLFDEPLSNLDAQLRVRMRGEIRELQHRLGITSVYVTHDQEEAFSIADVVAIMNKGRLIQVGTPRELYWQPADRFVAEFVGLSNVVSAELVESRQDGAVVRVLGQAIRSRRPPTNPQGPVSVVLRPEALAILSSGDHGVPARVQNLAFVGPIVRYRVQVQRDGTELTVDLSNPGPDQFYAEGVGVRIKLPEEVPSLLS